MNLPNKLTMLRIFLVPVFIFLLLCPNGIIPFQFWIAFVVYVVACLTDCLDGQLARRMNLVTNFGKFMDPLADKLLVCSAIICFVKLNMIPTWIVLIIIGREFIISGFRLIAAEQGTVIAAGIWGKIKTVVQMIMIGILLVFPNPDCQTMAGMILFVIEQILIYASLVLSVVSLLDYVIKNKNVLKETR